MTFSVVSEVALLIGACNRAEGFEVFDASRRSSPLRCCDVAQDQVDSWSVVCHVSPPVPETMTHGRAYGHLLAW